MWVLLLGMLICVGLAVVVILTVASPSFREGDKLLTPAGEEQVGAIRKRAANLSAGAGSKVRSVVNRDKSDDESAEATAPHVVGTMGEDATRPTAARATNAAAPEGEMQWEDDEDEWGDDDWTPPATSSATTAKPPAEGLGPKRAESEAPDSPVVTQSSDIKAGNADGGSSTDEVPAGGSASDAQSRMDEPWGEEDEAAHDLSDREQDSVAKGQDRHTVVDLTDKDSTQTRSTEGAPGPVSVDLPDQKSPAVDLTDRNESGAGGGGGGGVRGAATTAQVRPGTVSSEVKGAAVGVGAGVAAAVSGLMARMRPQPGQDTSQTLARDTSHTAEASDTITRGDGRATASQTPGRPVAGREGQNTIRPRQLDSQGDPGQAASAESAGETRSATSWTASTVRISRNSEAAAPSIPSARQRDSTPSSPTPATSTSTNPIQPASPQPDSSRQTAVPPDANRPASSRTEPNQPESSQAESRLPEPNQPTQSVNSATRAPDRQQAKSPQGLGAATGVTGTVAAAAGAAAVAASAAATRAASTGPAESGVVGATKAAGDTVRSSAIRASSEPDALADSNAVSEPATRPATESTTESATESTTEPETPAESQADVEPARHPDRPNPFGRLADSVARAGADIRRVGPRHARG